MCGIVGYIGQKNAKDFVINGLKRLEYRGYDSWGVALKENGNLKVIKEGFEIWQKEVVVFEDLVTDITALLVLKGGGLNPLTNTGVSDFALSKNGEMLAYLTKGEEKPGLWVLQLSDSPLNIFQTNKRVLALDSDKFSYSSGEALFWSPDDQEILVKMNDRGYLLLDTAKPPTQIPIILSRTQDIFGRGERGTAR